MNKQRGKEILKFMIFWIVITILMIILYYKGNTGNLFYFILGMVVVEFTNDLKDLIKKKWMINK